MVIPLMAHRSTLSLNRRLARCAGVSRRRSPIRGEPSGGNRRLRPAATAPAAIRIT
jgi:hypothetical protein